MENKNLWQKCLECDSKCCFSEDIFYPLYVTTSEKNNLNQINTKIPCVYMGNNCLCQVYDKRPVDCRLFPFDVHFEDGTFEWIIWEIDCPIAKETIERES